MGIEKFLTFLKWQGPEINLIEPKIRSKWAKSEPTNQVKMDQKSYKIELKCK